MTVTKVDWRDLRGGNRFHLSGDFVQSVLNAGPHGMWFNAAELDAATITRIEPEPTMTGEELDKARAREALRLHSEFSMSESRAETAARLAREGWTPKIDAAVLACREICAANTRSPVSEGFVIGAYDHRYSMKVALAAYRAGKAAK